MRQARWVAWVALMLGGCGDPSDPAPVSADLESRALAAYMETEYSEYLRDYIHVFLGYSACSYDFIDETVLNELADDVLRSMMQRGAELSRAEHIGDPHPLSDRALRYATSLAVLTTMEMWANRVSVEVGSTYEGPDLDCTASATANRARYDDLRVFEIR